MFPQSYFQLLFKYFRVILNRLISMAAAGKTSYPKEKIRILFLENISDLAVKNFQQSWLHTSRKDHKGLTEEELIKEIKDVHILGIRSKTRSPQKYWMRQKNYRRSDVSALG